MSLSGDAIPVSPELASAANAMIETAELISAVPVLHPSTVVHALEEANRLVAALTATLQENK